MSHDADIHYDSDSSEDSYTSTDWGSFPLLALPLEVLTIMARQAAIANEDPNGKGDL
jgi:hypothetical protein